MNHRGQITWDGRLPKIAPDLRRFPLGFKLVEDLEPGIKWFQRMKATPLAPCYLKRIILDDPSRWWVIQIAIGGEVLLLSSDHIPGQLIGKFRFHHEIPLGCSVIVSLQISDHFKLGDLSDVPPPEMAAECSLRSL